MKKKILVIDDEPLIRESLDMFITDEHEDIEVITAKDGKEGIDKIYFEVPDLIITDLKMPFASGHDVIKAAKSFCKQIPIIVISGNIAIDESGFKDKVGLKNIKKTSNLETMAKPVDFYELDEKLRKTVKLTKQCKSCLSWIKKPD